MTATTPATSTQSPPEAKKPSQNKSRTASVETGPFRLASLRLAPSHHLVPGPEGWLLYPPDGSTLRLKVDGQVMERVSAILSGSESADAAPEAVLGVIERFLDRGFATTTQVAPNTALNLAVTIIGEGPIAETVQSLLGQTSLPAPSHLATDQVPDPSETTDIVVACAGWLPDASWQRLDSWCQENDVAWHGCYAEGKRFYLGPYWSPSDSSTACYRDTRDRRLAAEFHPDGLEGYWRYLDHGKGVPPVPWPDAGSVAVIAGTLVSDVLAVARGERPPSHGHQLAFDPASGTWRRHPVLPVPRGLMTECLP